MYFGIGVCQCVAMIPGVSRSGATIVGAMLFGADRRSAAEFSFWLAMPTMVGAFAYEAFKSRAELAHGDITVIAVGFVFSFIFGWIVVKTFLRYVQRHSFALFAWWRIVVGSAGIYAMYFLVRRADAGSGDAAAELPGLAEAPEIGRHDRLDRLRLDAEALQRAAFGLGGLRHHIVDAQQLDLVGREQRLRQELQRHRLQLGERRTATAPAAVCARWSASTNCISSLNVRTSGPPSS